MVGVFVLVPVVVLVGVFVIVGVLVEVPVAVGVFVGTGLRATSQLLPRCTVSPNELAGTSPGQLLSVLRKSNWNLGDAPAASV